MVISATDHLVPAPQDGLPGQPAVGYYMVATPAVVTLDADGKPMVDSVTVSAFKVEGDTRSPYTDKATLKYYKADGNLLIGGPMQMPLTIKPTKSVFKVLGRFDVIITVNSLTVAVLSVPVVRNGSDGKDGADGTSFRVRGTADGHAASEQEVPAGAKGTWLTDDVHDGNLSIWFPEDREGKYANMGDAYIIGSDIWVAGTDKWTNLGQFRGPEGAPGPQGSTGSPGPMTYLAGAWQRGVTYTRTAETVPVVSHNGCLWMPEEGEDSLLNIEPSADSDVWRLVAKDEFVFAKFVMADFGKFGAAIMVGDYLISQYGRLNGETIDASSSKVATAYTNFNANNPEDASKFVPRLYINFRTGELHCEHGYFKGSIDAQSGTFRGRIEAQEGVFKGICRQPFVQFDGSVNYDAQGNTWSDAERYDNLALPPKSEGWVHSADLPWTDDCIGRRITMVNFQWFDMMASDSYCISAPDKKFFFEDGARFSSLTVNKEIVQLLGFGDGNGFIGWFVLSRIPVGTNMYAGHPMRILYMGRVTADKSKATAKLALSYSWDGGSLTLVREALGVYTIRFPWFGGKGLDFIPIVTGATAGSTTNVPHVFACVSAQTGDSFTVRIADDASLNEGGFNFIVLPTEGFI